MSAPARLLGLRVQGFKSFAERTLVEFGPGISAVVGPNGSGKSNLADSLRWALGEQGRSLRIRRSEDVIWAGSERRSAQGMADVTIVLDNADALLPVEYSVVELGRRLYRSGENDYLLNRQRVRLRDLVDLLDAANLADNAFLFIGQGMVDQALALRPEERRPLFEEVAGVRRHERRRRKAEAQLAEAGDNLSRVEDILAELRPQARRLGQLAEQQATRITAGEELAAALVVAAHARWHDAASRLRDAERRLAGQRAESAQALGSLEVAESMVAEIASSMAARADAEHERRARHEAARSALTALGLQEARSAAEIAAVARDRDRALAERAAQEAELAAQRRALAEVVPERDHELDAGLAAAERSLAEALTELAALRAQRRARGEDLAALRRAETARAAETETARRRSADADRRSHEAAGQAEQSAARRTTLEGVLAAAREALHGAQRAESEAVAAAARARTALDVAEGALSSAVGRASGTASLLAAARGRQEGIDRRLAEEQQRGIARAARRLGGRRLDEELAVDPELRPAVEAALGELQRAYLVDRAAAARLADERGHLVIRERLAGPGAPATAGPSDSSTAGIAGTIGTGATPAQLRRLEDALAAAGGGPLGAAVRSDAGGAVRTLLRRVVWVPDLASGLELQDALPPGWLAVTRDGSAVIDGPVVRLGKGESLLDLRAQADQLAREVDALAAEAAVAEAARTTASAMASDARAELDRARAAESSAAADRRRMEDAERAAGRDLEAVAREAAWHGAQATRLAGEADRAREALRALTDAADGGGSPADIGAGGEPDALTAWEARAAELRARRDGLAAEAAVGERARREAEGRRARADAAVALVEARLGALDLELGSLAGRERAALDQQQSIATSLARAEADEQVARKALEALLADDRAERTRLTDAERAATAARERLRVADERVRSADVASMEARLGLDTLREQVLLELAGLGDVGLRHLAQAAGVEVEQVMDRPRPEAAAPGVDDLTEADGGALEGGPDGGAPESAALERALDELVPRWVEAAPAEAPPSASRLGLLRRRFHELGAANPFAVDEYRAVRERLDSLELQHRDLLDAIGRTRSLIADLDQLIATQFRTTFAALEVAFNTRFQQLFAGGFARLALTDPSDLAATGVEITARPPGKKPQALSMLSGGERALTAVALLFAMLEVRPTPFCVLDEVDAALDEANVGRFTDALQALAEQTQFIVITHNRGTIEVADALYGVTVGDDSVSRVISLRLDEAQAIADDRRSAAQPVMATEPAG